MLVAMTFVTGLVDAFSYLVRGHVFVANMTASSRAVMSLLPEELEAQLGSPQGVFVFDRRRVFSN